MTGSSVKNGNLTSFIPFQEQTQRGPKEGFAEKLYDSLRTKHFALIHIELWPPSIRILVMQIIVNAIAKYKLLAVGLHSSARRRNAANFHPIANKQDFQ